MLNKKYLFIFISFLLMCGFLNADTLSSQSPEYGQELQKQATALVKDIFELREKEGIEVAHTTIHEKLSQLKKLIQDAWEAGRKEVPIDLYLFTSGLINSNEVLLQSLLFNKTNGKLSDELTALVKIDDAQKLAFALKANRSALWSEVEVHNAVDPSLSCELTINGIRYQEVSKITIPSGVPFYFGYYCQNDKFELRRIEVKPTQRKLMIFIDAFREPKRSELLEQLKTSLPLTVESPIPLAKTETISSQAKGNEKSTAPHHSNLNSDVTNSIPPSSLNKDSNTLPNADSKANQSTSEITALNKSKGDSLLQQPQSSSQTNAETALNDKNVDKNQVNLIQKLKKSKNKKETSESLESVSKEKKIELPATQPSSSELAQSSTPVPSKTVPQKDSSLKNRKDILPDLSFFSFKSPYSLSLGVEVSSKSSLVYKNNLFLFAPHEYFYPVASFKALAHHWSFELAFIPLLKEDIRYFNNISKRTYQTTYLFRPEIGLSYSKQFLSVTGEFDLHLNATFIANCFYCSASKTMGWSFSAGPIIPAGKDLFLEMKSKLSFDLLEPWQYPEFGLVLRLRKSF